MTNKGHGVCVRVCEVDRLEVCVGDGDPSQLHDLRVGHAPSVVAARYRLIIADVKAGS